MSILFSDGEGNFVTKDDKNGAILVHTLTNQNYTRIVELSAKVARAFVRELQLLAHEAYSVHGPDWKRSFNIELTAACKAMCGVAARRPVFEPEVKA